MEIQDRGGQASGTLKPRVSRFSYTIVPPHGVTASTIVLRGLPPKLEGNRQLHITVEFAVGGVTERASVGEPKESSEKTFTHKLKVVLEPELNNFDNTAGLLN